MNTIDYANYEKNTISGFVILQWKNFFTTFVTRSRNITVNSASLLSRKIHGSKYFFALFPSVIRKVRPIYSTCFSSHSLVKRRMIRFRFHGYASSKEDIFVGSFGNITSILVLLLHLLSKIENIVLDWTSLIQSYSARSPYRVIYTVDLRATGGFTHRWVRTTANSIL